MNRSCCCGSGVLENGQLKTGNSDAKARGSHKPQESAHSTQKIVDDVRLPLRTFNIVTSVFHRRKRNATCLH